MSHAIALVTGGSRGLGRNAAVHLARLGVDSIVTYRSEAAAAEETVAEVAAAGARAVALPLDTGDVGAFPAFAGRLSQILQGTWGRQRFDYLLNNAGIGIHRPFAETTEADFDVLVAVHLKGVFFLTQRLLPLIEDGGRILNVSSGLARFALPGYAAYGSVKGAVEVLTRYMAKELGARGIAVNVVAPGATATDFSGGTVRDNEAVNKAIAATVAMGRVGLPDDIGAAMAAILASDSQWMTAQRIEVSGGQSL